jgi:uncharacterized protein
LCPYLAKRWQAHLETYDKHPYQGMMEGPPYPKAQPNASRRDAYPPEGGPQGSSLSFMQQQHLDPNNVVLGVLNPLATGQGIRNHDLSAAICSAINDWQIEKWTSRDSRLKGSVVVANEDGPAAAAEIRKRAGDSNFIQVLLLSRNVEPLGQRRYWPIYEAAEEAGLPVGVHAFGFGGNPITASGWPSYYIEEMVGHSQCQQTALASIVLEGVFERHPKLKMIMIEAGFGWAPSLSWRLDKSWQRMRSEVPHVKRPPSETIRDHIFWTTQPMEDPERRDHLFDVIDWVGWDKLLFATDYPHWDFDEPSRVLPAGVSEANRDAFYLGNARKLYGLALHDPKKWEPVFRRDHASESNMTRHVIAPVDELPPGTRKFLTIDERPIAVFNIKGEFFGLLNRCPHQGAALCEGPLIGLAQSSDPGAVEYTRLGEIIRCPWHGWEFDIRTGQSYCDPKRFFVKAYPVNVETGLSVVKGPYIAETIAVSVESDYVVVDL